MTNIKQIVIDKNARVDFRAGSAGGACIGDPAFSLRAAFMKDWSKYGAVGIPFLRGEWSHDLEPLQLQWLRLSYANVITFRVNILLGRIGGIELFSGYLGPVWNDVRVGATLADFIAASMDHGWDTDGVISEQRIALWHDDFPFLVVYLTIGESSTNADFEAEDVSQLVDVMGSLAVLSVGFYDNRYEAGLFEDSLPTSWTLSFVRS